MRIQLKQTFGAHSGRVVERDEGLIRLGRHPDNDVAFHPTSDLDASAFHAEIRYAGDVWTIFDMGSRNGTWRKGVRVDQRIVQSGDEYEFGPGGPRIVLTLDQVDQNVAASTLPAIDVPTTTVARARSARSLWIAMAAALAIFGISAGVLAWFLLK